MVGVQFVKAHEIRKNGPLTLVVPKVVRQTSKVSKGTMFAVSLDGKSIVYTPVPESKMKGSENLENQQEE
jgi:hypothetical protein